MAYPRRYLSGLTATTITIADKSITRDKLADDAVITRTIADDAVISKKILNKTILAEDIKDGQIGELEIGVGEVTTGKIDNGAVTGIKLANGSVSTEKIVNQAVTTQKIADGAVTPAKISGGIAQRPLVPPIATAEVADGAIIKAKLAANSVDSAQIIAGAVDDTKLKTGAVTNTKLGAGAVSETKLAAGAVTNTKLGPLAVKDVNIDWDAIKQNKTETALLARRHWNSFLVRESIFSEEFGGIGLSNKWASSGEAGGLVVPDGANGIKIQTGGVLHDTQKIDFGGNGIAIPSLHLPSMVFMLTGRTDPKDWFRVWMGLRKDINNYISFCITDVPPNPGNWKAQTRAGGVDTTVDTGVASINGTQVFEIEVFSPALIRFYINGELVASIDTNIPSDELLEPYFYLDTGEEVAKYWLLKYVNVMALKPSYV